MDTPGGLKTHPSRETGRRGGPQGERCFAIARVAPWLGSELLSQPVGKSLSADETPLDPQTAVDIRRTPTIVRSDSTTARRVCSPTDDRSRLPRPTPVTAGIVAANEATSTVVSV